jgi:hypothetical protein
MRKLLNIFGALALFGLFSGPAAATCTGLMPAGDLCGNSGASAAIPGPVNALPSLATSQLYGGTGGAGVAQHFPAGTGVETALQQNIGSAGAPVLFNGAGGEPSSIDLTNATKVPFTAPWYLATQNGLACDNSTDDTAALNALMVAVGNNKIGGTIFLNGRCVILGQLQYAGASTFKGAVRITGMGSTSLPDWDGHYYSYGSELDLRYNAPYGKILLTGGQVELDHVALVDSGSDCAPFIKVTNTRLYAHDNTFIGNSSGTCYNDAIIWGGLSGNSGSGPDDVFTGYGSKEYNDHFASMGRIAVFNETANSITLDELYVDGTNQNNTTLAISSATNASSAELTAAEARFNPGDTFKVNISGFTGSWTPLNGTSVAATATAKNKFTVAVNSTTFGAMTGTPVIPDGEMFYFFGGTPATQQVGNRIIGGTFELYHYAYFAKIVYGGADQFIAPGLFDNTSQTIGDYNLSTDTYSSVYAGPTQIINGFMDVTGNAPSFLTGLGASTLVINNNVVAKAGSDSSAATPTAPNSTSTYTMQGLAGAITPSASGNVFISISGTIVSSSATVNLGIIYQISHGTGSAPTTNGALAGTQDCQTQEYTGLIAATAAGDIHQPFSISCRITGLAAGTTYWLDLAAKAITTANDVSFVNVNIATIEQ